MVSNWDRYEETDLPDEDSLPMSRGQDFNQLLQGAGMLLLCRNLYNFTNLNIKTGFSRVYYSMIKYLSDIK